MVCATVVLKGDISLEIVSIERHAINAGKSILPVYIGTNLPKISQPQRRRLMIQPTLQSKPYIAAM